MPISIFIRSTWVRALFCITAILLFSSVSFAADIISNDPTMIGVGARTLGMGKAYAGVADDILGIYMNPAALAEITKWQATSMAGKLINEYNYLNAGVALPLKMGTLGIGYVGNGIGFSDPTVTIEVIDGQRFVPSTTESASYSYGNNALLVSWGAKLNEITNNQRFENVSVGATLKTFFANVSGPGITGGNASGNEMDFGAAYEPNKVFKLGMALQDALPVSMGGKLRWGTGVEESFPAILKSGFKFHALGNDGWKKFRGQELSLMMDYDVYPKISRLPGLLHIGSEWTPAEFIDIRAGVEQDYKGKDDRSGIELVSNLTFGVGLFLKGFRFDYAFHQYNQVSANDTHYFSITYGIFRGKPKPKGKPFDLSPADKTILYQPEVKVTGEVLNDEIKVVKVNSIEVAVNAKKFQINLPLELRKNSIIVAGYDKKGKFIDSMKIRILRMQGFADVAIDHWAVFPIAFLAMENVLTGYPDGTFKPEGNITRAEKCTMLIKTMNVTPEAERAAIFSDVSKKHWALGYINEAAEEGIVKGYPDGTFRPKGLITRAEGVSVIARFDKLPIYRVLESPFPDLPSRHWAIGEVSAARSKGTLKYLEGKSFEPNRKLSRSEVAEMLSKTKYFADQIADLLDWNKGY